MSPATLPPQAAAQLEAVIDGAMRVGPLIKTPLILRELGHDPDPVCAAAGIDPDLFDDPENIIPFAAVGRFLSRCAAHTRCPHFGLLLGQKSGLDALGLVGMYAEQSPNVGTALRNIVLHLHLHDRGAIPTLTVTGSRALLGYAIYQPVAEGALQIYDGAISIAHNIMGSLCGAIWQPLEVLFSHARPADIAPYRRAFRAPLRFDAEQTALAFPAAWLGHRIPNADPVLYQQLSERIATILSVSGIDIVAQVRRIACNLLMCGGGSVDAAAEVFAVHRRTLNRRLRERGVTFRQLFEEVRQELAKQLLRDTDLPVLTIAETLGYADAPAFTHAFRRWSGTTPTAWRAARRRS